jgi:hypothetical protein
MQHLNRIPDSLFRQHLSEFLAINDVVEFDNACLNHEYRPLFLDKIKGMVLKGEKTTMSKELFEWLEKRNIYLTCLLINWRKGYDFCIELDRFNKRYDFLEWFTFIGGFALNMIIAPQIIEDILKRSPKLRHLIVDDCRFKTDVITSLVGFCPNLLRFESLNSALTDKSITSVAINCLNLRILRVSADVKLKDSGIISISTHCKDLEELCVVGSDVTDESIISIATHCRGLLHLNVSCCLLLTDASIISISFHCARLEKLSVRQINITDESIMSIATHCRGLLHLNVSCCSLLTDESIKSISSNCSFLREINLMGCKISDASILSIASHCPCLSHLEVAGCQNLTDASFISISTHCTSLEVFNLNDTNLSNEGLCSIAIHCKKLRILKIFRCSNWYYLNNPWTTESLKSLEYLNVSSTNISDPDIRVIAENCIRLESLVADNCFKTSDASFLVLLYKLYFSPVKPMLINLCVCGHFGMDENEMNFIPELKRPCEIFDN